MTTISRLRTIIVRELGCDPDAVTPEANLITDLGADSLSIIQIAMGVEEWIDREISDAELDKLKTVGDAVRLVDSVLEEA